MKTIKEVHQEYSDKVQQAKKDKFFLGLNNLSAGDREAVKFLEQLSHTVGGKGNLARLVQIFMAIE